MASWTTPIFDRTQTDVDNKEDKAYHDYDFFNRVEENSEYIADEATTLGYPLSYTTKYDWDNDDEYDIADTERILDNIQDIKDAIPTLATPTVPSDMVDMSYSEANDIEEIESKAYNIIQGISENTLYTVMSGGTDRTRQLLQRG
jgi:hypothetical protein